MPFLVTVAQESRLGLVAGSGHVTCAELTQSWTTLVTSPAWTPGFDEVWDLSQSTEVDVSPTDLDALVAATHALADRAGAGRCVFVYTRGSVEAVLRLFEWRTADLPRTYHTTRTRAEALRWLGLPPDALAGATGRE